MHPFHDAVNVLSLKHEKITKPEKFSTCTSNCQTGKGYGCFKYGGKTEISSKTDDEELEIGSTPQDLMTHFWRLKRFYRRQKQTTRLLGHQATIATNGDSSYMFLVCPARALIISVLISALYYSLKISLQLKFAIKKLKNTLK